MARVLALMFWVMAVREAFLGYLRGYGRSFVPMVLSLPGMIGVRQLYLALTLGRAAQPDIRCLYRCYPVGWASTAGLLFVYFLLVRKKLSLPRGSGGHPG